MLFEIKYENPGAAPFEGQDEFYARLKELAKAFETQAEVKFEEHTSTIPGAMGGFDAFMLVFDFLHAHADQIKDMTIALNFLKAVRDTFVSLRSKRTKKGTQAETSDSLTLQVGKSTLKLPVKDGEIEVFLKKNLK